MKQLETVSEPQPPIYALHEEATAERAPTLRDFLAILKRRKSIAIQAFVLVLALGVIVTLMTKPTYRSSSRVLVEGKTSVMTISNSSNPLSSLFLPSSGHETETQVEILRSSQIAAKASKASNVPPGKAFLEVRRVASTDVIELSTTSTSSSAAYNYLKAVPVVYLRDMRGSQMREVSAALEFAQKRLKEENVRLRRSELALQNFKQRRNVVDPTVQREGDLTAATSSRAALDAAEGQADSLRAQLEAYVAARKQSSAEIVNPTTTTNTEELQSLRQKIADLKSQRAQALYLYKPNDDHIRQLDLQIADYEGRLTRTPRTLTTITRTPNPAVSALDGKIADTRASMHAAEANVALLRTRLSAITSGLKRYNPIEREQGQLQRDILGSTGTVTSLSQSVEELSLRKKALESANDPITVIEAASQPVKISPNVRRNLVLAIALGLLLACGAAMLQESLDDHMRDEEEVRRTLSAPILGHFPIMHEGAATLPVMLRAAQKHALLGHASANGTGATSPFADRVPEEGYAAGSDRTLLERFRVLRSNVQFTQVDRPHSTLLVTSTVPQEGKSYTASNLASAMALDGKRVILIDADLHRPRQHTVFDLPVQPGLTNILVGQAELKDCLRETGVVNLRLLPAGVLPPNPVELLNSPSMEAVLETLKADADIVIFDSPPLLATSDAQVLASKLDGVLYVMQLGSVPKSAVARAFELLEQARANVLGITLNKIGSESNFSGYYNGYYNDPDDGNGRSAGDIDFSRADRGAAKPDPTTADVN